MYLLFGQSGVVKAICFLSKHHTLEAPPPKKKRAGHKVFPEYGWMYDLLYQLIKGAYPWLWDIGDVF